MKIKLAIIFGILIWLLTYVLTAIFNPIFSPIFTDNIPQINVVVPIIMIIVTGFFGILYIRNIENNEVIEGFLVGIIFIIIDIVCDYIFFIIPQNIIPIIGDFTSHVISMTILTLLITTFLGYLAQMNIDLK